MSLPENNETPAVKTGADGFLENPSPNPQENFEQTDEAPVKKRGRPKKDTTLNAEKIESGGKTSTASKPSKRRAPVSAENVKLMGKQICGVHMIAAQVTGLGELMISEDEGYALASSIVLVAEQYDLSIDGKTGASLQLLFTAAMIYGPRALVIRSKMNAPKSNVVAPG